MTEVKFGARKDRIQPRTPTGLDVYELRAAGIRHRLQAPLWLAGLELGRGHVHAGRAREHALIQVAEQLDGLGARSASARQLAGDRRDPRLGGQRPTQNLAVARQPSGLDGRLGLIETEARTAGHLVRVREADRHRRRELPLPRSPRDGDAAAQMADRILIALGEILGEPEVVGGVEPQNDGVVPERVQPHGGRGRRGLRRGDPAKSELGEAHQALGDDRQRRLAERDRGVQAALRPRVHRREVAVIQSVGGQLDLEVRGDHGPRIGDVLERGHEPAVGGLVAAEQVLAHGAAGDQSGAQRSRARRRPRPGPAPP